MASNTQKDFLLQLNSTPSNTKVELLLKDSPQLNNSRHFLEYYKIDTILNSKLAQTEFVVPDKKPLPNIIEK